MPFIYLFNTISKRLGNLVLQRFVNFLNRLLFDHRYGFAVGTAQQNAALQEPPNRAAFGTRLCCGSKLKRNLFTQAFYL